MPRSFFRKTYKIFFKRSEFIYTMETEHALAFLVFFSIREVCFAQMIFFIKKIIINLFKIIEPQVVSLST